MKLFCSARGGPLRRHRRIVKAVQKGPQGRHLGQRKPQAPFQAGIPGQQLDVLRAVPADGLQEQEGFDELALGETALAAFEREIGGDQVGQMQRAEGAGGGQQAGVAAGGFLEGPGIDGEGRLVLDWNARRHGLL